MSLNINSPAARQLAAETARSTGETLTAAVTQALRERHARLRARGERADATELTRIAERVSEHMTGPYVGHGELLYDDDGLPRWTGHLLFGGDPLPRA